MTLLFVYTGVAPFLHGLDLGWVGGHIVQTHHMTKVVNLPLEKVAFLRSQLKVSCPEPLIHPRQKFHTAVEIL